MLCWSLFYVSGLYFQTNVSYCCSETRTLIKKQFFTNPQSSHIGQLKTNVQATNRMGKGKLRVLAHGILSLFREGVPTRLYSENFYLELINLEEKKRSTRGVNQNNAAIWTNIKMQPIRWYCCIYGALGSTDKGCVKISPGLCTPRGPEPALFSSQTGHFPVQTQFVFVFLPPQRVTVLTLGFVLCPLHPHLQNKNFWSTSKFSKYKTWTEAKVSSSCLGGKTHSQQHCAGRGREWWPYVWRYASLNTLQSQLLSKHLFKQSNFLSLNWSSLQALKRVLLLQRREMRSDDPCGDLQNRWCDSSQSCSLTCPRFS